MATNMDVDQARRLFQQGMSCRAIARELGVSPSTVSTWAKREGLSFPRAAQTRAAAVSRQFDMAESRMRLLEKMAAAAFEVLDRVEHPYLVYAFGGRENTYAEHLLDRPPVEAIRGAVTTAAVVFDRLTKAIEKDPMVSGVADAEAVLDRLEAELGAEFEALEGEFDEL